APILAIFAIILVSAGYLWFAISLIAFMGFLLPAPLPVLLLSSPLIFNNVFGWLGAIGFVGIGLVIAGAAGKRRGRFLRSSLLSGLLSLHSACAHGLFL